MGKIVLIGASGFIGSAILQEALDRGHQLTALVRNPEKISITHPNLKIKQGDAGVLQTLLDNCSGADAVISAYNPGWKNPDIAAETSRVYPVILDGVKRAGVKRFLVVGGAGSLFVSPGVRMMDTGIFPENFMPAVRALADFYLVNLTQETELDWVFFSPAGMIEPGTRTGVFRLGKDNLIKNEKGESRISSQDYAVAMIDEFEKPAHHRERFTIGY